MEKKKKKKEKGVPMILEYFQYNLLYNHILGRKSSHSWLRQNFNNMKNFLEKIKQ